MFLLLVFGFSGMEVCGCVVSFSTRVIYILANKG